MQTMKDHAPRVTTNQTTLLQLPHPASPAASHIIDELWNKRLQANDIRNKNAKRSRLGLPPLSAA